MRNGDNALYYANTLNSAFGTNAELTDATGPISTAFYGDYKGLGIQGDDVLAAWADSRNGDYDIYFSRGVGLAGPTGTAIEPGTERYRLRNPWKTSAIGLYDVKGAKVKGGKRPAAGKYVPGRKETGAK
jgi:hypothetical protein